MRAPAPPPASIPQRSNFLRVRSAEGERPVSRAGASCAARATPAHGDLHCGSSEEMRARSKAHLRPPLQRQVQEPAQGGGAPRHCHQVSARPIAASGALPLADALRSTAASMHTLFVGCGAAGAWSQPPDQPACRPGLRKRSQDTCAAALNGARWRNLHTCTGTLTTLRWGGGQEPGPGPYVGTE